MKAPRLGRQPVTAAPNDTVVAVPVFTPDPHGAAMFAGVTNGTLGHLGARPVLDTGGEAWHGWTAPPQAPMRGAGNLGTARPVINPTTRLDQAAGASTAPDAVQSIFEQRMVARRFS